MPLGKELGDGDGRGVSLAITNVIICKTLDPTRRSDLGRCALCRVELACGGTIGTAAAAAALATLLLLLLLLLVGRAVCGSSIILVIVVLLFYYSCLLGGRFRGCVLMMYLYVCV